jgi:quercetin dioxygenase-like cupin family protein
MVNIRSAVVAACVAVATPAAAQSRGDAISPILEHAIPNIPGKSLVAVVVDYAPGGASPAHAHPKSAFIYGFVVSDAIESQVNDGLRRVYHAGESFYEDPLPPFSQPQCECDRAAKLLAVFVVDTDDKALTGPGKQT